MPQLRLLYFETATWKRMLGSMMEENTSLKNRLTFILKDDVDTKVLNEMETFQNSFVKEDILINILRSEVMALDLLIGEHPDEKIVGTDIDRKHHSLRTDIITAEKQFSKLKNAFNHCMETLVN